VGTNFSGMKIGIYDVDSKIPNLALMKISAWHKAQGDNVEHYMPLAHHMFDRVYASKIFDFSDGGYLRDDMIMGGTGIDIGIMLPDEIEDIEPDYTFYGYKHNIGFLMRGCRFKCGFCVVPRKEGGPRSVKTIENIWTQRSSNFIVLLDNDFFGNPDWSDRIEEILAHDLRINFSQGLNIRIISERQAQALALVKFRNLKNNHRQVTFAWDKIEDEKVIKRGFDRCVDAGIKPYEMQFYVLIGFNTTEKEDLHRVEMIKNWGADPYVMPFNKKDKRQMRFARWVNHRAVFNTVNWTEYNAA
jgi:hypothetical protein|tara:strand:- start:75 stop:977 length:903 start_codon:yes stop_codon:yes gene_type:complete